MLFPKSALLFTSSLILHKSVLGGCPHAKTSDGEIPNDGVHNGLRGQRRLASLTNDEITKKNIASFFDKKRRKGRSLQTEPCVTTSTLEALSNDLEELADLIDDLGDRGHFLGGIVRLAAHDFMDFDQSDSSEPGGSDGCLDLTAAPNAGLDSIWCDDAAACPYKQLFDEEYSQFMSKADFWVAGATKVIEFSSTSENEVPFKYGRPDNAVCPSSSSRLPADSGCTAVEGVFLDRMGLSWTDATALLGAHTLGRGDANFSGHPGTWVDTAEESTVFDKRYYRELLQRGWRPRFQDAGTDWVWGGDDRFVMMLNADICLAFDIPDGNDQNCCTNTERNCRDVTIQCPTSETVRPEAYDAVQSFDAGSNTAFYNAFSEAWIIATENGIDNLKEVTDSCSAPTPAPTLVTTPAPTLVTTPAPTLVNTPAPTLVTTPAPTGECSDVVGDFLKKDGKSVNCEWVLKRDKCHVYGLAFCPVSCDLCSLPCEDVPSFEDGKGRTRDCDWAVDNDRCHKFGEKCMYSCGLC